MSVSLAVAANTCNYYKMQATYHEAAYLIRESSSCKVGFLVRGHAHASKRRTVVPDVAKGHNQKQEP